MKILIYFSILFTITLKSHAYTDQIKYNKCILENTSERDKIILVKWIFGVFAEHPSLDKNFIISEKEKISYDKAIANYLTYIFGEKCFNEAQKVLTNKDGITTFLDAFELLGKLAFDEITNEKKVSDGFKRYVQYIDPLFFEKFGGLME